MMAEQDKTRFDAEMKQYPGDKGRGGKRKRSKKDPNAPKRSLSAFFWFCNDERQKVIWLKHQNCYQISLRTWTHLFLSNPQVKGMNPEYGIGDVAKELGRLWAMAPAEVKQKYQAMSDKDKARYEREMHMYKSKPNGNGNQMQHQYQFQQHQQQDDDEEEESEEDY